MNLTSAKILTTAGIIVAVCAAAKLPAEGEQFPTTTAVSLGALAVAAMGLVAWRIADRRVPVDAGHDRGEAGDPIELARQILQPVRQLCADAPSLDGDRLREEVDQIIDRYVLPFTSARDVVVHRLGIRQGAELVIDFALGERLLNRVWSAAADGHLPEALAALRQAEAAFSALPVPQSIQRS
jgi:hypothetical protein